jgi:hypothetical protein
MNKNVAIIILNWNGWEDTIECLKSLYKINYQNYHVILVDNGSEDESIEKIKNYCLNKAQLEFKSHIGIFEYDEKDFNVTNPVKESENKELTLLKNTQNYGYAKGNNIGIRFAFRVFGPDYILLLNNDTTVDRNFLKELVNAANNLERLGICAPKILNADNPQIIDSTGHIFSWGSIIDRGYGKVDKNQYDHNTRVVGAKGAAALYKREMLEEIGLFKEDYITYYEDAELSWRANRNSWEARYVPKSVVFHKGESSIKKDNSKTVYFRNLGLRNMTLTVKLYGTHYQRTLFTLKLLKFLIGSKILRLAGIRNSRINYINLIKELYDYD